MDEYKNTSEFREHDEVWTIGGKKCQVHVSRNSISDQAIRDLAAEIIRIENEERQKKSESEI